jgi:hypothetical protein
LLLELRSTTGQTVVPPSTHEEGEAIVWHAFTEPARLPLSDLHQAVSLVAAVALLARHWTGKSGRQNAYMALSGGLHRGGFSVETIEHVLAALADVTRDEEARKRVKNAAQTGAKLEAGAKVTGWPKLAALLGEGGKAVVDQVRRWLGIYVPPADGPGAPPKARYCPIPPYEPFPTDALPVTVCRYVEQSARALGCDESYLALPALAALASAVGNSRVILPFSVEKSGSLPTAKPCSRCATEDRTSCFRSCPQTRRPL